MLTLLREFRPRNPMKLSCSTVFRLGHHPHPQSYAFPMSLSFRFQLLWTTLLYLLSPNIRVQWCIINFHCNMLLLTLRTRPLIFPWSPNCLSQRSLLTRRLLFKNPLSTVPRMLLVLTGQARARWGYPGQLSKLLFIVLPYSNDTFTGILPGCRSRRDSSWWQM